MAALSRLEIRLFGGCEVRVAERTVHAFESKKVRGLLAYLATRRQRPESRESLANLLWAEKSDEAARRNLRQALHNLRTALEPHLEGQEVVEVHGTDLRLAPQLDCWLDVEQFEAAMRNGITDSGVDSYQLAIATRLYAGDFLAGFAINDSPPFEEWQLAEQERLREAAIEAFKSLITASLDRGEHRIGIQHARRLLAIDPLSESVHRMLMRLYALSGQRSRALAQFEKLRSLLASELAVEPMPETVELHQSILTADSVAAAEQEEEPVAPLVPLVGRGQEFAALQHCWTQAQQGRGRLTLVRGPAGVGKSRLVRSLVDAATSRRTALVLQGHASAGGPVVGYGILADVVANALLELLPDDGEPSLLDALPSRTRHDLTTLCPDLEELTAAGEARTADEAGSSERIAESLLEFLDLLAQSAPAGGSSMPVVVILDDLRWADHASLELLAELAARAPGRKLWLVACLTDNGDQPELPAGATEEQLVLEPLSGRDIDEIAASLVEGVATGELSAFLRERSAGMPLLVTELINFLWDEGLLEPREAGRWSLAGETATLSPPADLLGVVQLRLRRLPTSTRRLLALAAVLGQRFDATLLQRVDGEHMRVVEICLETALERWLVRHCQNSWTPHRPESDLALWAKGARRDTFEFAHEAIREAILRDINPIRKRALHAAVAARLAEVRRDELETVSEEMAFHLLEAGEWERALPCLERAAQRAAAVRAGGVERWYLERVLAVLERLLPEAGGGARRRELDEIRQRIERRLAAAPDGPAA